MIQKWCSLTFLEQQNCFNATDHTYCRTSTITYSCFISRTARHRPCDKRRIVELLFTSKLWMGATTSCHPVLTQDRRTTWRLCKWYGFQAEQVGDVRNIPSIPFYRMFTTWVPKRGLRAKPTTLSEAVEAAKEFDALSMRATHHREGNPLSKILEAMTPSKQVPVIIRQLRVNNSPCKHKWTW